MGDSVGDVLREIDAIQAYVDSLDGSVGSSMARFGMPAGDEDENCDAILTKMEFQMKDLMDLAYKIRHGFVRFPAETATFDEEADVLGEEAGEVDVAEGLGDLDGEEDGEDLQGEDGEDEAEEEAPGCGRVFPVPG
ncbi:hypothetical protein GUITHDRAFT_145950 [Guillardia theta CCMP2712]|uniref:Uncharacterized protein n=1 Tax=Guillardia theta (strain CCMP2712) TaxID=905079 RepID=L1IJM2_GUITC|nr:hypothetical protein GUITHDRAFT_145950 [Guillardia theta CCMP2712]EKX36129.1 hypothetical protein GUITHDRAFT_145950 [Guillardia theta CCMP2712]|eukprot:XP_005823109.1 hypothetical protein GUITHDRAFT_145950 [Guillardia theta CCMP2712]